MSGMPAAAFEALGGGVYRASTLTRGPWDPGHQHAGPPIALVAREIDRVATPAGFPHLARLTCNLIRPVPIGEIALEVQTVYSGRSVAHYAATISSGGKPVALFTAVAQRQDTVSIPPGLPGHPLAMAPRLPEDSEPARFPFRTPPPGYPDFVETRVAAGTFFRGPSAVWFRLKYPLVVGEAPTALETVAASADSGNGISAVLDFGKYLFQNSDLTINLLRAPQGEWICVDARTLIGPGGGGLAESQLFDQQGLIGRATQSLAVRMRE